MPHVLRVLVNHVLSVLNLVSTIIITPVSPRTDTVFTILLLWLRICSSSTKRITPIIQYYV
jgi:hypothetical protein